MRKRCYRDDQGKPQIKRSKIVSRFEKWYYLGPCLVFVDYSNGKTRNMPLLHKTVDKRVKSRVERSFVGNLNIMMTEEQLRCV